jgi:cyclophilin family peptidyl-prolyl cis-trans isomerase/HEAT repeat protein
MAELDVLEQQRSLGNGRLIELSRSSDVYVRIRALEVLGRLQRAETVDAVIAALADPDARVRDEAAWAAGMLGLSWQPLPKEVAAHLSDAVAAALNRLPPCGAPGAVQADGTDTCPRAPLIEALGRIAQPSAATVLEAQLHDIREETRQAAGLALGILAVHTQAAAPGVEAIEPLAALLANDTPRVRFAAAYALMRTKRPEARPALTFGLKDADGGVRAICARGLADVAQDTELPYLLERLGDADLWVRVESARALGKRAAKCATDASVSNCKAAESASLALTQLVKAYSPEHPESAHPLLALLQESLPAALTDSLGRAMNALPSASPSKPSDVHDRAVVAGYLAAATDHLRKDATTPALNSLSVPPDMDAWREAMKVRTLAGSIADADKRAQALLHLSLSSVQALGAVDDGLGELKLDTPEVRARLLHDLYSPDFNIALSAADAAGKLKIAEAVPGLERVLALAEATGQDDGISTTLGHLAELHAPDAEARIALYLTDPRPTARAGAIDAMNTLKGKPLSPLPEPELRSASTEFHGPLETEAVVHTSRGDVTIKLTPGSRTAGNFIALANRHFFDQLSWHRVVPGFVVQGGDPRGDGSGGPGYEIPCEITRDAYSRGAVGMALSGKDTGGSQFFITLEPAPHLEGRYTIFGYVTEGMSIADQLMEGDLILSVELREIPMEEIQMTPSKTPAKH